ncbi:VOC family protein [Spirosoma aureum]|uniref:VOC family protein n=1 Tax=Spirosoma aureum TaxID=2692134 RepID=A0A6G9ARR8_9BACT|nr:VOC family protein [Spirosoma aureum]QIP15171.1 VOC family protein [Spirosoma aureum]
MELDHIFIFTHQAQQVATALQSFGLSEGTANVHPGQGTACRRFFFQNAYIELVWVINEDEIKHSEIKRANLWERSQYEFTNYCPFGFCFRTEQPSDHAIRLVFEDGWRYYSVYLPQGQFANIASNEAFPVEPMLFEMPFFGLAPKDYPQQKRQPLTHANGFQELTKVTITLPPVNDLSSAMKKVLHESILHSSQGNTYLVTLEFDDGKQGQQQNFTPLIPLVISW